jgi:hypothetical protein
MVFPSPGTNFSGNPTYQEFGRRAKADYWL